MVRARTLRRRLTVPLPRPALRLRTPGGRWVRRFFVKAYTENLTGLAGMVAYNLLLSIFPLALLALFVFGLVLQSPSLEESALRDLREIFPTAAYSTLTLALDGIRRSSTSFGIFALLASLWIGSSFWGALDTAFSQSYHVPARSWVEQKRFGVAMIGVVLLFMAATVFVPTVQAILKSGARDLPLGLAGVESLVFALTLVAGLVVLFGIFCVVFWTVPNRPVPWAAVWPGALAAMLATGAVDYAFPLYLSNISTVARVGTTFVFVLIVLLWFYALSAIILGGATINAMRLEAREARPSPGAGGSGERSTGGDAPP
jgi:YihY family inner membrane protein